MRIVDNGGGRFGASALVRAVYTAEAWLGPEEWWAMVGPPKRQQQYMLTASGDKLRNPGKGDTLRCLEWPSVAGIWAAGGNPDDVDLFQDWYSEILDSDGAVWASLPHYISGHPYKVRTLKAIGAVAY